MRWARPIPIRTADFRLKITDGVHQRGAGTFVACVAGADRYIEWHPAPTWHAWAVHLPRRFGDTPPGRVRTKEVLYSPGVPERCTQWIDRTTWTRTPSGLPERRPRIDRWAVTPNLRHGRECGPAQPRRALDEACWQRLERAPGRDAHRPCGGRSTRRSASSASDVNLELNYEDVRVQLPEQVRGIGTPAQSR